MGKSYNTHLLYLGVYHMHLIKVTNRLIKVNFYTSINKCSWVSFAWLQNTQSSSRVIPSLRDCLYQPIFCKSQKGVDFRVITSYQTIGCHRSFSLLDIIVVQAVLREYIPLFLKAKPQIVHSVHEVGKQLGLLNDAVCTWAYFLLNSFIFDNLHSMNRIAFLFYVVLLFLVKCFQVGQER